MKSLDFLETRCNPHADREIQVLALKSWQKVRDHSFHLFGDYSLICHPDGSFELNTPWKKV